jgi:sugar phosphate permease
MWSFARWAGAMTLPLVVYVFRYMNWRGAFVLFGGIGLIWAFFFYRWFRDNPRDHKSVNKEELALLEGAERMASGHGNVPWGKLISSRTVWLLWAQYFCLSFPWYFYITWLPDYLQSGRKLDQSEASWYGTFPLLFGGFGSLFCGMISARVAQWTGSVSRSRRLLGSLGFFGAAVMLVVSIHMENPLYAMVSMGMASFCNDLVMPGAWGSCMDVGGRYAGTLSGSMNMMGNLAGFVAPWLGGRILDQTGGDWNSFLYLMAGVYALGTVFWPFIDPVTPLEKDDRARPSALPVLEGQQG